MTDRGHGGMENDIDRETFMTDETYKTTLDVRDLQPRDRHPLIFDSFLALRPGEAMLLVNDHDPKPLYYQFQAEHSETFAWDYLEQGPEVWQVRIGKLA